MDDQQPAATDVQGALKDANGNYSSKRIVAFLALGLFAVGFLADTFTSHHPSPTLMDDLMIIILGGLGLAMTEWFAWRKPQ